MTKAPAAVLLLHGWDFLRTAVKYLSTSFGAGQSASPKVRSTKKQRGESSMQKLTAQQDKFAQAIALEDMNQADAYRSAYNTSRMSDETIWVKASNLAKQDKVRVRITELRAQAMTPKVMNAQKRREKLSELAEDEDPNVAMKAIDLLNKMDGEYVQKIAAEVQTEQIITVELVDE